MDCNVTQRLTGELHFAGQVVHDGAQRRTGLRTLDTGVRHKADGLCRILCGEAQSTGNRSAVLEGFTHHADVRVGVGACRSQNVSEVAGVGCRQAESGQGIGNDIRGRGQILAGSGSEVHDALDAVQHVFGFPARHRHVFKGGGSLGRGELGLAAHLAGLGAQGIQIIAGRAGDGRHLAHAFIEVSRRLHSRRTDTGNGQRDRHHLFTGTGDGIANGLHLLADLVDLLQRSVGVQGFLL